MGGFFDLFRRRASVPALPTPLKGMAARWPVALHLFEERNGTLLYTFPNPQRLVATDNERGYESLSGFQSLRQAQAFWLYDLAPGKWMELSVCGMPVWEGRLENRALVQGGFRFTALGAMRAVYDQLSTCLFSTTSYVGWHPVTADEVAGRSPERWYMDNNNRLYIALLKSKVYGNGSNQGELVYKHPHRAETSIVEITFDYDVYLDTDFEARITSRDESFGSNTLEWQLVGNGAQQTGTGTTVTLVTGRPLLLFQVVNLTGAPVTFAGADASRYAKITNLRIKGTTSAAVYADEVIAHLISRIVAVNPAQIADSSSAVQSPNLDLTDAVWQDKYIGDILNDLAGRGDDQTPPRKWEWAVWESQLLVFRPRGSGALDFYIDVDYLELESALETLRNRAYTIYQDPNGRTLRTLTEFDEESFAKYGVYRRAFVQEQTTSETKAIATRDAFLEENKTIAPQASFTTRKLYGATGEKYPLWVVRSGDNVTLRNLPPSLSLEVDKIRTFRVVRKSWNVEENTLTLTPEFPLPDLVTQIGGVDVTARQAGIFSGEMGRLVDALRR